MSTSTATILRNIENKLPFQRSEKINKPSSTATILQIAPNPHSGCIVPNLSNRVHKWCLTTLWQKTSWTKFLTTVNVKGITENVKFDKKKSGKMDVFLQICATSLLMHFCRAFPFFLFSGRCAWDLWTQIVFIRWRTGSRFLTAELRVHMALVH